MFLYVIKQYHVHKWLASKPGWDVNAFAHVACVPCPTMANGIVHADALDHTRYIGLQSMRRVDILLGKHFLRCWVQGKTRLEFRTKILTPFFFKFRGTV